MTKHPVLHSVHIYDEPSALINRLCGIVKSALEMGNSVLIVATASHRNDLVQELGHAGVNVRDRARDGRFAMYDAKETLASFMLKGRPDRDLFLGSVGKLLDESKKNARSAEKGLTVFGEMVAVLWDEGNKEGALELESLWNDVLNDRAFHLHCAYPRWTFINDGDDSGLAAVCHAHSHVLVQ